MPAPKLSTRMLRGTPAAAPAPAPAPAAEPEAQPPAPAGSAAAPAEPAAARPSRTAGASRKEAPAPSIFSAQMETSRGAESRLQETRESARWPIDELEPDPEQPRTEFDAAEIDALAKDIEQRGLDRPVDLREERGQKYIVDGERRWRAYRLLHRRAPADARWVDIPARLLPSGLTLDQVRLRQLAASLHHLPYSAIDYARQLAQMADLAVQLGVGADRTAQGVVAHLAEKLSRSPTWVRRHLYLVEGITADELRALQTARPGLPLLLLEEVLRAFRKAGSLLDDTLRTEMLRLVAEPVQSGQGEGGAATAGAGEPERTEERSYRSAETLRRLYSQMLGRAAGKARRGRRPRMGVRRDVVTPEGVELECRLSATHMQPAELDRLAGWLRAKAGELEALAARLQQQSARPRSA